MNLPRNIPTSFVPQSAAGAQKKRTDLTGVFGLVAYFILAVVFVGAVGVFFYGRILSATQLSKDSALAQAEAGIDAATVEGFVELRDRLTSSKTLLANHVQLTNFFTLIENILPSSVRFTTMHLTIDNARAVKLDAAGVAKSFNALAAASSAFAADGHVKDAIFSNLEVTKENYVSFSLSATLDPRLVAFKP